MAKMKQKTVDNLFSYHAPNEDQAERSEQIRSKGKEFVELILEVTPVCSDQNAAIRQVREAVMTANAAIACNE